MAHKLGLIGYGGMAEWHHKSINESVEGLEVIAAFDIRQERLDLAEKNGLIPCKTLEELLSVPGIDMITVAVPNNFHAGYCIAAMKAGKNVVCEKPVTMNSAELEEVIAVSKETGKLFTVHQNRRWDGDFRIVKKSIEEGLVGKPYYIENRVQGSGGKLHGWRGSKENGGGMLYDWGVHLLDQVMWLVDSPVKEIYCQMKQLKSEECDDNFKLYLEFENGVSAHVQVDTYCFIPLPRWQVQGDEATLVVSDWECNGKIVRAKEEEGVVWTENIVYTAAGPTRTMAPRRKETIQEDPLPKAKDKWSEYYRNVMAVLDEGAELIVKPEQSLRVMKVIDAAFESARTGHSVSGPF
ncbi:MAG: Gfo/Idh/MocA family oxidoreductase [Clostridia bacterium]|nr:Gfo/Idh/MocA family oxidoreductase [Clostridia bacterium]